MKWYIPREHGGWAMFIVPLIIGLIFSEKNIYHILLFAGALSGYIATSPLLSYIRKPKLGKEVLPSLLIFSSASVIFIMPIFVKFPFTVALFLMIVPFFIVNLVFAKLKKERHFINDVFAICGLSFLILIAFYIGNGEVTRFAITLMFINIFYFIGTVFHVKTFLRERGNVGFAQLSHIYHGLLLLVPVVIGYPSVALAYAFSALKTWLIPKHKKIKPLVLGIVEIANSAVFLIVLSIIF